MAFLAPLTAEGHSPLQPAIKTLPHVAFEVDDLEAALEGHHCAPETP